MTTFNADSRQGFVPSVWSLTVGTVENLKTIGKYQWHWLTQLKSNRQVNLDRQGNQPVSQLPISEKGSIVHLKGYGLIKVFKIVSLNGNIEYWATNNLSMDELFRLKYAELSWSIEEYHRGIKQLVGVRCLARTEIAQRNHIGLALRAFLRIERHCFLTGITWFEAKASIIRDAVCLSRSTHLHTKSNCVTPKDVLKTLLDDCG